MSGISVPKPDPEPPVPCRRLHCPKCGEPPSTLNERWDNAGLSFIYDAEAGTRSAEGTMSVGDPTSVFAECAHGHRWKLRGVQQIIDLDLPTRRPAQRPRRLTSRAREILQLMVDGDGTPDADGELVTQKGQWWVGTERTGWRTVVQLIRLSLIKCDEESADGFQRWVVDAEEARRVLADPGYETRIEEARRTGQPVCR